MTFWPKGYHGGSYPRNLSSAEIEQRMRERDARLEDFADNAARILESPVADIYEGLAQDLSDQMTITESMKVLGKLGAFQGYERRERLEAWINAKKIRMSYTAHTHEMAVQLWETDIIFKEAFEQFPSEYLLAQIALAIEAGVVK